MPRFTARVDWNAGVGGGDERGDVAAICNGRVIDPGPGGAGDWLNDQEFVCARAGYREIHAIDKDTGAHRVLFTSTTGLVGKVWAGGGRFAYRIDGVGHFLDTGESWPLPIVGFGHDGSLVTQAHPFAGTGLVIEGAVLSTSLCWDVQVLDRDRAVWREQDGPHAVGLPVPRLLPGQSYGLRVVFDGTRWWVLYQASEYNGKLVLHPFDSFDGYALTEPGVDAFRADVVAVNGGLRVIWATVESEQLGQIAGPVAPTGLAHLLTAPPPVVTPPVIVPRPTPEPPHMELPDPVAVLHALERAKARLGHVAPFTSDEMVAMLNGAASEFPHMGLHRKDGHGLQPLTKIPCSRQILRWMPPGDPLGYWSDVLGATGAALAIPLAPEWKRSSDGAESFVPAVVVGAPPTPPPPVDTGELAQLRAENARLMADAATAVEVRALLEHKVAELQAKLAAVDRPSYDAMTQLVGQLNATYRAAQKKKEKDRRDMDPGTVAHLVWRFLIEGYRAPALLEDARARGAAA